MIFAHTLDAVLNGRKTQTRRVIKPGEYLTGQGLQVRTAQRMVYEVGRTYAIQPGRGKKAVGRFQLIGLRKEAVSAISEADAKAEGFVSRDAFLAVWQEIHGAAADLNQSVWVLQFCFITPVISNASVTTDDALKTRNHRSSDHRQNLPASLTRLSGTGLHSGNNANR